ncbi:MAG: type I-U CRISPR-associated protein Cas8c, partial [Gammaproteobacteria bacterium]
EGGFDWSNEADVRFILRAAGERNPVEAVLAFLAEAHVCSAAPDGSSNRTEKWDVPTISLAAGEPFPFPDPDSPATLPARLIAGERMIEVAYWGDATSRDNVKFWAGAGGYPGAALLRDALDLMRGRWEEARDDPFSVSAVQTSSFRFDWRRDYVPLDAGFSPNEHGDVQMVGYPLVEILAAIGLSHARPLRIDKLLYRYGVIGTQEALFAPLLLRAALGCAPLPFARRQFRMELGWPGQENQARCILEVTEETIS